MSNYIELVISIGAPLYIMAVVLYTIRLIRGPTERLTKYFSPVDVVCVVRRNQASNTPFWHSKALQHNFYLRGFKYLIIVKKEENVKRKEVKIRWNFYER